MSGAYAQNFIRSHKFEPFCDTFSQLILSNLRHLRLCNLHLDGKTFTQTLQSFDRLEELGLFETVADSAQRFDLQLNLPMLKSLQFVHINKLVHLTLDAPRLREN